MANRVVQEGEISLNGKRYRLAGGQPNSTHAHGKVRGFLASQFPPKIVTGDTSGDSNPRLSTVNFSDFRGGIGLDVMSGGPAFRAWTATAEIQKERDVVLPPLVTTGCKESATFFASYGAHTSNNFLWIAGLCDAVCNVEDTLWRYSGGSCFTEVDRKNCSAHLGFTRSPGLVTNITGTPLLLMPGGGLFWKIDKSFNATKVCTPATHIVEMDGRIWGWDSQTNQLWYSYDLSTTTNVAKSASDPNICASMFEYRDNIYVATHQDGLQAYDIINDTWVRVPFPRPLMGQNPITATVWRDSAYIAVGTHIFRYTGGPGIATTIECVGPYSNDGLADGDCSSAISSIYGTKDAIYFQSFLTGDIYRHDGIGTVRIVEGPGKCACGNFVFGNLFLSCDITTFGDDNNLFFTGTHSKNDGSGTVDPSVSFIEISANDPNPLSDATWKYAAAGQVVTPWFHADQADVEKLARRLKVETLCTNCNETVTVSYALNYCDSCYTSFSAITSAGQTIFDFPNSCTPSGTTFRSIRLKADLARGCTNTNTPRLVSMDLEYRKKLDEKEGFEMNLDLGDISPDGRGPAEQRNDLRTARQSSTLVEFTYRDDAGNDRNYYVDITGYQTIEDTGSNEKGQVLLTVEEA